VRLRATETSPLRILLITFNFLQQTLFVRLRAQKQQKEKNSGLSLLAVDNRGIPWKKDSNNSIFFNKQVDISAGLCYDVSIDTMGAYPVIGGRRKNGSRFTA
jgi:hypothetical protein